MSLKLVYPALALILWMFVVLGILFLRRKQAFAGKQVRMADVAVSTEAYPQPARWRLRISPTSSRRRSSSSR